MLKVFENQEFGRLRLVIREDGTWFVGRDVAEMLGYAKARNAIAAHVDEEDKKDAPIQGNGGTQEMTIINESGLYALVLSSKLPQAKQFKHWVTSEILPSIHKHGAYMTPEKLEEVLLSPDTLIQLATNLKNEQEARKKAEKQVAIMAPKAKVYDEIIDHEGSFGFRDVCKMLKINERRFGELLRVLNFAYKQGKRWKARPDTLRNGYAVEKAFTANGCTLVRMYITLKGIEYLKPLCEVYIKAFGDDSTPWNEAV